MAATEFFNDIIAQTKKAGYRYYGTSTHEVEDSHLDGLYLGHW